jgi:DNA processing protein
MNVADGAYAAALVGVPGAKAADVAAALRRWRPAEAWARARVRGDPRAVAARLAECGVRVTWLGQPDYPAALEADHQPPPVLFFTGDLEALDGRTVAIVGSRDCTRYGRDVAYELGRDLAAQGVRIVSGLALGIDGAAHGGALAAPGAAAPPVAVVGSGLDVVYPRRHTRLWREVAAAGVVLSEAPVGAAPEPWRFPLRNRIIAALAEIVVVVESRHQGGSRHTIEAAMARDRQVMAVPGPVRSPTSALPNALLADGCHPARDAVDVLVALGLATGRSSSAPSAAAEPADPRPPPSEPGRAVLDAMGWERSSFEQLVLATGRSPGEVGVALAHLECGGWVAGSGGSWERVGRP